MGNARRRSRDQAMGNEDDHVRGSTRRPTHRPLRDSRNARHDGPNTKRCGDRDAIDRFKAGESRGMCTPRTAGRATQNNPSAGCLVDRQLLGHSHAFRGRHCFRCTDPATRIYPLPCPIEPGRFNRSRHVCEFPLMRLKRGHLRCELLGYHVVSLRSAALRFPTARVASSATSCKATTP